MVRIRILAALVVAACAFAAVPAGAQAKPASTSQVTKQARAAKVAVRQVRASVAAGHDRVAVKRLRTVKRRLAGAERLAAKLRRRSSSRRGAKAYASAQNVVGGAASTCAETLAAILDQAGADAQVQIAAVIRTCLADRQQALDNLTGLVEQAPPQVRDYLAGLITQLTQDAASVQGDLTELLNTSGLPPEVVSAVTGALAELPAVLQQLQEQLGEPPADPGELPALPSEADVEDLLDQLLELLGGTP